MGEKIRKLIEINMNRLMNKRMDCYMSGWIDG